MRKKSNKNSNGIPHVHSAILAVSNADAEVSIKDTIAHNRACQPVQAAEIPTVPAAFKPTEPEKRRRSLRVMPAALNAEALHALEEIAANEESKTYITERIVRDLLADREASSAAPPSWTASPAAGSCAFR